jgi:serine/threonine-protein kinase
MKQCPDCQKEFKEHLLFCPFDGHALASKSEPDRIIGTILDNKYRIEEKIGQGGMGKVYRATHIHMDHTVAIKVLHSELSSDQIAMERFRREARAAAQIHHQNAVAVTDFGVTVDDTVAYLVMEFLEGLDLGQRIKQSRQMRIAEAFYITRQICAALHAAHGKGIIHRDLKPDNIWLVESPDGGEQVKVLDFGIAKLKSTTEMIKLTQQGTLVGTPHYMSPEQCRGEELDPRSDIYSLGVILYEMLTGELPFQAATPVGVVIKHATEPPSPPRWIRPDIPQQVEDVVLHALEKKRERRPASALHLAQEFEAALYASGISFIPSLSATPASPFIGAPRAQEMPGDEGRLQDQGGEYYRSADSPKATTPFTGTTPQRPTTPVPGATDPLSQRDEGSAREVDSIFRKAISYDQLRPDDSRSSLDDSSPSWPSNRPPRAETPAEPSDHSFSQQEVSFTSRPPISTSRLLVSPQSIPEQLLGVAGRYKKPIIAVLIVGVSIALAIWAMVALVKKTPPVTNQAKTPNPPAGMIFIRGNSFKMGTDDARGDYQSKPEHVVRVNDFFLDINEVTNEEYLRFVKEKSHPPPTHWRNGQYRPGTSNLPVVNVSWSDAKAYAEWVGKRLPTEAEWEYAARGDAALLYPWGNDASSVHANVKESGLREPAAAGSYPEGVSWCGAKDLAGNVSEWVADDWNPYPGSKIKSDPRLKIFRGGSFINSKDELIVTNRYFDSPTKKFPHVGFRCAK